MKIAVCVKQVPSATIGLRIDPDSYRLDRSGEAALNAFDANAIEEGLRIRDAAGDGEVVLVSLGPEKAVDALRKGLAMGADRAVLISDQDAAGSDLIASSYVLAKALERESPDLVLFGQQASDSDGAVLGAAIAERLGYPLISQVAEFAVAGGTASGKRQTEFGYDTIEAALPAVIAFSDAINEPRYPSLKGIMTAKTKPFEQVRLADLDVAAERAGVSGSKTVVSAVSPLATRRHTQKVTDEGNGAQTIFDYLIARNLL